MKKTLVLFTQEESGRTLIEIIASIVLLSIIAIPFAGMFVQSSKSINVSDEIIDATYVAQTEMEWLYHVSSSESGEEKGDLRYTKEENDFYIETDYKDLEDNLVQVIVKVYEYSSKNKLEAQMESIYLWRED